MKRTITYRAERRSRGLTIADLEKIFCDIESLPTVLVPRDAARTQPSAPIMAVRIEEYR